MAQNQSGNRLPAKRYERFYKMLATGHYAAEWLSEFIELYELVLEEKGEKAADAWAIQELSLSVKFSITLRLYRMLHIFYKMWKVYRKKPAE